MNNEVTKARKHESKNSKKLNHNIDIIIFHSHA